MKKNEIENRLSVAFENSTPEVFDRVMDKIGSVDSAGNLIALDPARKKKKHTLRTVVSLAAAFAIVFGLYYGSVGYLKPAAKVSLDVNPSIEMRINSHDHIITCSANNDDAVKILDGMDLRGTDIDVAVNALIGSMLKNGYLSEMKNSVLVTVMDAENAAELQKKLSVEIADLLNASIGSSSVISQTLSRDSSVEAIAKQFNISQGKAALISELIEADSTLTAAELSALPVNDLSLLSSTRDSKSTSMSKVGQASSKEYIGTDKAKSEALKLYPGATVTEIELDCCNGKMAYEIELICGMRKYELELDAVSGKCLEADSEPADPDDYEIEDDDDDDAREAAGETSAFSAASLTGEQAIARAFADAGLKKDDVTELKAKIDYEDNMTVYKIEFKSGRNEYEYEIDAATGRIIEKE